MKSEITDYRWGENKKLLLGRIFSTNHRSLWRNVAIGSVEATRRAPRRPSPQEDLEDGEGRNSSDRSTASDNSAQYGRSVATEVVKRLSRSTLC